MASNENVRRNTTSVDIATFLVTVRRIVAKIRNSPLLWQALEGQLRLLNIKPLRPLLDCKTRQNSTDDMLQRLLHLRPGIEKIYLTESALYDLNLNLKKAEWDIISHLVKIFTVFSNATKFLSGTRYPTLWSTLPYFSVLMGRLEKLISSERNATIKKACNEAWLLLRKYYTRTDSHSVYAIATILDPRMKLEGFKVQGWKKEDIEYVCIFKYGY